MSQQPLDLEARIAALEADRGPKPGYRRLHRRHLGILVLAISLAAPAVVLASHRFTDVPTGNTFHNQISVLAAAGVTTGCNPAQTLYCPADPVRRDQMAAFLIRAAGRMTSAVFEFPDPSSGQAVASATIKTEGTATIHAVATFYVTMSPGGAPEYPCEHLTYLSVDGSDQDATPGSWTYGRLAAAPSSTDVHQIASQAAFVVAGGNHTVSLVLHGNVLGNCDQAYGRGTLTATVIPFSSIGGTPVITTIRAGEHTLGSQER